MNQYIEEARKQMEDILDEFEPFYNSRGNLGLKVSLNHPRLIGRGTTTLVFELGSFDDSSKLPIYLCGKVSVYSKDEKLPSDYVGLMAHPPGGHVSLGYLETTILALNDMGFEVPFHHEVAFGFKGEDTKNRAYVIAEDLRNGGQFVVNEAHDFDFSNLTNGAEIKQELQESVRQLSEDLGKYRVYASTISEHRGLKGEKLIQHIFLIQYDPQTMNGKLIPGDLDHFCIV